MKKTIGYLLLIILAVQSLFTGYSINNQFEFLYEYAFVSMPGVLASPKYLPNLSTLQIVHWIFLVIAYICMAYFTNNLLFSQILQIGNLRSIIFFGIAIY